MHSVHITRHFLGIEKDAGVPVSRKHRLGTGLGVGKQDRRYKSNSVIVLLHNVVCNIRKNIYQNVSS